MGGAFSVSVNNTKQKQNASFAQNLNEECESTCTAIQDGDSTILNNSTTGNIIYTNSCTATASCLMTAAVSAMTTAVQQSVQNGTANPSLFPGIQISSVINNTESEINNAVTQALTAQCNTTTFIEQNNDLVYAKNSTTGNITFSNSGNATASCVENFTVDAMANLNQKSSETATSGGTSFSTILTIIAIIFFIIVLFGVVLSVFKSKKKNTDCNSSNPKFCLANSYKPLPQTPIARARPIAI